MAGNTRDRDEIPESLSLMQLLGGAIRLLPRAPSILYHAAILLTLRKNSHKSWGGMLERNAKKYGDKIAIKFSDSTITYRQLNQRTNQYANYFLELGIKKGDIICLFIENSPELLVIYSALAKIGGISALINTNLRRNSLRDRLNRSGAKGCIVGENLLEYFVDVKDQIEIVREDWLFSVSENGFSECKVSLPLENINKLTDKIKGSSQENPNVIERIQLKNAVAHISTSGTTGLPKSAIIDHKRLIMSSLWFGKVSCHINSNDTLYCPLPFYHGTGLIIGWPIAVVNGASIAFRRKFSVSEFLEDARKFDATGFVYVGELLTYLLKASEGSLAGQHHPMRFAIGNGLRKEIWKKFQDRFQIKTVCELYAASESLWSFANIWNLPYTVGACFQRFSIVYCDTNTGMPLGWKSGKIKRVKKGEEGLLLFKVTSKYPFLGYTDKKSTEQKLLRDVFRKNDAWFNTGDLMQYLGFRHARFVDRLGDTYRWKGENVSTREIESYTNSYDQVNRSLVYGVKIPNTDGRAGMVSVISGETKGTFDVKGFSEHLIKSVPHFARPLFLRLTTSFESTDTFKDIKTKLQNEGYDISKTTDPIFVLSRNKETYVPLTQDRYRKLAAGTYGF